MARAEFRREEARDLQSLAILYEVHLGGKRQEVDASSLQRLCFRGYATEHARLTDNGLALARKMAELYRDGRPR